MNNPFKEEKKPLFKTRSKNYTQSVEERNYLQCEYIGSNAAIDIIAEACACCWDKKVPDTYEERCEYVAKRTRTGHTSILEHSNCVMYIKAVGNVYVTDLIKFLSWNKYLNVSMVQFENNSYGVLISGSYRAYSYLYTESDDLNNSVLHSITFNLYHYAPMAAFEDIVKLGLMDANEFERYKDAEIDENDMFTYNYKHEINENLEIIGIDDYEKLVNKLATTDIDFLRHLTKRDLIKHVTVTVLFKNMSRIITQQLCRHRNAITQESQRYVDYSKACFNSPALFKDNIDPEFEYRIKFGTSGFMNMTLQQIGEACVNLYSMLHNKVMFGTHALVQEDARAFLPGNVQCRKIYMTFTYDKLFKFLLLREASGAQAEIRKYATELGAWIRANTEFSTKEITDGLTKPKMMCEPDSYLDMVIDEIEEEINVTEDDYIKAAGLNEEE